MTAEPLAAKPSLGASLRRLLASNQMASWAGQGLVSAMNFVVLIVLARFAGATDTLDYVVSGGYYRTDGAPAARGGKIDVGSETAGVHTKLTWSPSPDFRMTAVARSPRPSWPACPGCRTSSLTNTTARRPSCVSRTPSRAS